MKLKKTDVALIFSKDGSLSIEVPKLDPVPDYVQMATALAVMLSQNDKSLMRLIKKQMKIFAEFSEKEEKNTNA